MTVDFSKIDTIIEKIDAIDERISLTIADKNNQKRWLNTRELSGYIGYSMDAINKMVKENIFIDGVHYHKPQKKLLFDVEQVNNWIIGIKDEKHLNKVNEAVANVLKGIE